MVTVIKFSQNESNNKHIKKISPFLYSLHPYILKDNDLSDDKVAYIVTSNKSCTPITAREMGTPCPSKEEDTNPSAFVNLTSLPKTRAEEDINTQSKFDLKAQSLPHQVDYMDNNLTNRRKCNGAHLRSDNEVSLLKSLVDKTEIPQHFMMVLMIFKTTTMMTME